MRLSLIVAMSRNRVIGRGNQLPWRMPADLKYFKRLTMDHAVIMGRRTFDSIGGKPLSGRTNIVVTRRNAARYDGAVAATSFETALTQASASDRTVHHKDEVFVLGGSEIFREALPRAHRIYCTLIEADIEGDTFFPEFDRSQWTLASDEVHAADSQNPHGYRFQIWNLA